MRLSRKIIYLSGILLISACTSLPAGSGPIDILPETGTAGELSPVQNRLLEGADRFIGAGKLKVNGRTFPLDCTGTVLAIYAYAGIDLATPMNRFSGNGVSRLNAYLDSMGLLYSINFPVPGDLIFWDDTYDRNGDGLWNDPLTHVGMVLGVEQDGTIYYVHHNYRRGIVVARMNLLLPDSASAGDKEVNSAMRMRDGKVHPRWLASHLYRELGQGWKAES